MLREVKRATDPKLASLLAKVRLGECDDEVVTTLQSRLQRKNVCTVDSIIISSKRDECEALNKKCLERLSGNVVQYVANDTDNKGHPLRKANLARLERYRSRHQKSSWVQE